MKAAAGSLMALAADPRHLGAEIGFLMVLHTWAQTLTLHPHVHCVIPGGGLTPDGRWVSCRPGFFLPVNPLSRLFRGKFLAALTDLHTHGRLTLAGDRQELTDPGRFAKWIDELQGDGLGGVRQAAIRRPAAGAEVPGPVHPPGGHLEPSA